MCNTVFRMVFLTVKATTKPRDCSESSVDQSQKVKDDCGSVTDQRGRRVEASIQSTRTLFIHDCVCLVVSS